MLQDELDTPDDGPAVGNERAFVGEEMAPRETVMVSIVKGNQLDPESERLSGETGTGETGTGTLVVRLGAVMTVDHEPGLPDSGTVTVRTTVAVLLGPSGMVTVTTEPSEMPGTEI